MNELLAYLLKFSISLSLVTIFYSVFLRRLTFYNWNRWYLLLYPVACLFLPMLDIGWWMESEKADLTALQQLPALDSLPISPDLLPSLPDADLLDASEGAEDPSEAIDQQASLLELTQDDEADALTAAPVSPDESQADSANPSSAHEL